MVTACCLALATLFLLRTVATTASRGNGRKGGKSRHLRGNRIIT